MTKKIYLYCFVLSLILTPQLSLAQKDINEKQVLKVRLYGDLKSMDWHYTLGHRARWVLDNVMEGLFSRRPNNQLQPFLLEKWKLGKNGKTYTFHLMKKVKWSDGVEMTANDFIFAWKKLLSPKSGTHYPSAFNEIVGAKDYYSGKIKSFKKVGIKKIDKYTLQVKLKRQVSGWEGVLSSTPTFPMREDLHKKYGKEWTDAKNIVTIGPYKIAERVLGQKIVLERNPHYYGKKAKIPKVEAIVVENEQTAIKLFLSGKLDVAQMVSDLSYKNQVPKSSVKFSKPIGVTQLGFSIKNPKVKNKHLRRAIAHAINRKLFKKLMGDHVQTANRFVPSFLNESDRPIGPQFDLRKASKELKKSGFNLKDKLVIDVASSGDNKTLAELIQSQLKNHLGLKVEVNLLELNLAHDRRSKHESQMYLVGQAANNLTSLAYVGIFSNPENFSAYDSKEFNKLLDQANKLSGYEQSQVVEQAEEILLNSAVTIPLYWSKMATLLNPKIKTYKSAPNGVGYLATVSY